MKKRTLRLDKELVTAQAQGQVDGGYTIRTGVICFACDYVITRIIDASIDSLGSDCCGGGSGGETCGEVSCGTGCTGVELC